MAYNLYVKPSEKKELVAPTPAIPVNPSQEEYRPGGSDAVIGASARQVTVVLDPIDGLPVVNLPERVARASKLTLSAAVTALANESTRTDALARILARDIQVSRIALRYMQARRNLAFERYVSGDLSARKFEIIERSVKRQHRMLLESIHLLSRLDSKSSAVKIMVDKAAMIIQGDD